MCRRCAARWATSRPSRVAGPTARPCARPPPTPPAPSHRAAATAASRRRHRRTTLLRAAACCRRHTSSRRRSMRACCRPSRRPRRTRTTACRSCWTTWALHVRHPLHSTVWPLQQFPSTISGPATCLQICCPPCCAPATHQLLCSHVSLSCSALHANPVHLHCQLLLSVAVKSASNIVCFRGGCRYGPETNQDEPISTRSCW